VSIKDHRGWQESGFDVDCDRTTEEERSKGGRAKEGCMILVAAPHPPNGAKSDPPRPQSAANRGADGDWGLSDLQVDKVSPRCIPKWLLISVHVSTAPRL